VGALVTENGDDGVALEEADDGDLKAKVVSTDILSNDDKGLAAEQGDAGEGLLKLANVTLEGNGEDEPDLDGVDFVMP
jgi:hypothetical protein